MNNLNQQESVFDFEMTDNTRVTIPAGNYVAKFKDCQKTNHQQWGEGLMLIFEIVQGEFTGHTVTRIGKQPNTTNIMGKLMNGMRSNQLEAGQKFSLRACVGQVYWVNVENATADGSKTRIANIAIPPQQTAPVAQQPTQQPQPSHYQGQNGQATVVTQDMPF